MISCERLYSILTEVTNSTVFVEAGAPQLTTVDHFGISPLLISRKPLNLFIGSESHIGDPVFSVIIANQQPLSTVEHVNKILYTLLVLFYPVCLYRIY